MSTARKAAWGRIAGVVLAMSVSVAGVYQVVEWLEWHADRYPLLLEQTYPVLSGRDGIPKHNWDLDGGRPVRIKPADRVPPPEIARR